MLVTRQLLADMVNTRMPFGKFQNTVLCNLPVAYLEAFDQDGYPAGKLGLLLQSLYEMKAAGTDHILERFKTAS